MDDASRRSRSWSERPSSTSWCTPTARPDRLPGRLGGQRRGGPGPAGPAGVVLDLLRRRRLRTADRRPARAGRRPAGQRPGRGRPHVVGERDDRHRRGGVLRLRPGLAPRAARPRPRGHARWSCTPAPWGRCCHPARTTSSPCWRGCGPTATLSYDVNARPVVTGTGPEIVDRVERIAGLADVVKASDEDLEALWPDLSLDRVRPAPALVRSRRRGGHPRAPRAPVGVVRGRGRRRRGAGGRRRHDRRRGHLRRRAHRRALGARPARRRAPRGRSRPWPPRRGARCSPGRPPSPPSPCPGPAPTRRSGTS